MYVTDGSRSFIEPVKMKLSNFITCPGPINTTLSWPMHPSPADDSITKSVKLRQLGSEAEKSCNMFVGDTTEINRRSSRARKKDSHRKILPNVITVRKSVLFFSRESLSEFKCYIIFYQTCPVAKRNRATPRQGKLVKSVRINRSFFCL